MSDCGVCSQIQAERELAKELAEILTECTWNGLEGAAEMALGVAARARAIDINPLAAALAKHLEDWARPAEALPDDDCERLTDIVNANSLAAVFRALAPMCHLQAAADPDNAPVWHSVALAMMDAVEEIG